MSRQVFTWFPDAGSQCDTKPNVQSTKFGDGYEVRTPIGINSVAEKWSVKFTRTETVGNALAAFLKTHAGALAFDWTNPDNVAGVFVCREWKRSRLKGGASEITCTFEQVFEF